MPRRAPLQVLENAQAVADILVTIFDHDIQPVALVVAPDDLQQLPHAGAEADAVLTIEDHFPWDRRRPVLIQVALAFQMNSQPLCQMVSHEFGQIVDKLHTLRVVPSGEFAGLRFELVRVEDAEAFAALQLA